MPGHTVSLTAASNISSTVLKPSSSASLWSLALLLRFRKSHGFLPSADFRPIRKSAGGEKSENVSLRRVSGAPTHFALVRRDSIARYQELLQKNWKKELFGHGVRLRSIRQIDHTHEEVCGEPRE